eukprot:CAMPEP_0116124890 /NCGR_PEP_ID=MMETSP0329-20121206/5523_1 /TAXON_ID=697910 /ORGANISM="Pseudo-nitzschia arenysensis, Strain B593" /LENGTH=539 /DNA_ID=CAMNT_0003618903 /DNA_START=113 /DNA_END=1729 /DNA_ORIENTATION=+
MKNLSANKVIVLAACAASTASSTTSSSTVSSAQRTADLSQETTRLAPWVVKSTPRGGANKSDDDDHSSKSKKSSSQKKKKKSTKSTKEETKSSSSNSSSSANDSSSSNPLLDEIMRQEDLYEILGVSKTATDREITKAYRKRCVQTHPDKTGGDRRAFDKVAEAYDVLSDSTKRQTYNRFGKAGLDPTNPANAAGFGGGGASDMFRSMFQQAQQQRQQQQRRNQTLRYQLEVTLEDLYYGRTQSVMVAPPRTRRQTYQYQRQQQKEVEVHIEKGSLSGQSIVMSGEVDFNNDDSPPGDLVFILSQKSHSTFTRKGHDLAMEVVISLEEALCGLKRSIKHLDGSNIWIESAARQSTTPTSPATDDNTEDEEENVASSIPVMIRTGDVQVLKGRGMPKRNENGEFGDLYVQYRVEMPENPRGSRASSVLTDDEYKELSRLLSKLEESNVAANRRRKSRNGTPKADDKVHTLQEAKSSDFGTASGRVSFEEEEGPGGGFHEDEGFDPFGSTFFGAQGFGGGRGYSQQFHFGGPGGPFGGSPF